jgi:hypothetical protein
MLAPGAPLTVGPLSNPNERYAVFDAAFKQASAKDAPARTTALDQTLVEASRCYWRCRADRRPAGAGNGRGT